MQNAIESAKEHSVLQSAIDRFATIAMVDGTIRIILAVVLLIAGIHLLQQKISGVKFTKFWAITRMIVADPLALFTITAKAEVTRLTAEAMANNSTVSDDHVTSSSMAIGFGVIILSTYPIISLISLSRPSAKNSLTK